MIMKFPTVLLLILLLRMGSLSVFSAGIDVSNPRPHEPNNNDDDDDVKHNRKDKKHDISSSSFFQPGVGMTTGGERRSSITNGDLIEKEELDANMRTQRSRKHSESEEEDEVNERGNERNQEQQQQQQQSDSPGNLHRFRRTILHNDLDADDLMYSYNIELNGMEGIVDGHSAEKAATKALLPGSVDLLYKEDYQPHDKSRQSSLPSDSAASQNSSRDDAHKSDGDVGSLIGTASSSASSSSSSSSSSKRLWGSSPAGASILNDSISSSSTSEGEGYESSEPLAADASVETVVRGNNIPPPGIAIVTEELSGESSRHMSQSHDLPPDGSTTPESGASMEGEKLNNNKTRAFFLSKTKLPLPTTNMIQNNKGGSSSASSLSSPPVGFELSARVYINRDDRLAYFDSNTPPLVIPYWDCGHIGSTTSPLPLKSAVFRHALSGATSWSGTDGKHAVLVVTLSPIAVDLNSGESRDFAPGSVILLEDVLIAGHKIRPLSPLTTTSSTPASTSSAASTAVKLPNVNSGVSVLFLTLPQQYIHTGKDHISLPGSYWKQSSWSSLPDPCPNESVVDGETETATIMTTNQNDTERPSRETDSIPLIDAEYATVTTSASTLPVLRNAVSWNPRHVRRGLLALFGFSLSTLGADFLAKTAPLWLAVGVGGICFVATGTWAMTQAGDALWMILRLRLEKRKLRVDYKEHESVGDNDLLNHSLDASATSPPTTAKL